MRALPGCVPLVERAYRFETKESRFSHMWRPLSLCVFPYLSGLIHFAQVLRKAPAAHLGEGAQTRRGLRVSQSKGRVDLKRVIYAGRDNSGEGE